MHEKQILAVFAQSASSVSNPPFLMPARAGRRAQSLAPTWTATAVLDSSVS
jgi:hypothetical protein